MRRLGLAGALAAMALLSMTGTRPARHAEAATTCLFVTSGTTMRLQGNCTTDSSIIIPNGFTLDGQGNTITGVDPLAGHFTGGVVQNGGAVAHVRRLAVTVSGLANVCDAGAARLRGILFDDAGGSIQNTSVVNINQGPSGCQEGNAIEVRNFSSAVVRDVKITDNTITGYQKTGIVANGLVNARIEGNTVDGLGPVGYIARNGIQIGYGATGQVMRNTVNGNSYTGSSAVSGGILVVGGPGYGGDYVTGVQIVGNTITGNDVGVYLSNSAADYGPPPSATNNHVVNNIISHTAVTNGYVYQAGVSDAGNNDKIINNTISGAGYSPCLPGFCAEVDADLSFTNRPKVHANK